MKKIPILSLFLLIPCLLVAQKNIRFNDDIFDFNYVVKEDGVIKYRFNFKNTTGGNVRIIGASTDCYFIDLDWFRPPVSRNAKAYVQVILNPSRADYGKFTEKIIVYTSADESSPIVLTVMGEIVDKVPEISIEPYMEYFGVLSEESSVRTAKYISFIENVADYVREKGELVLLVESSMSPMTVDNYAKKIAQSRADNIQEEIIKSLVKYDVDSKRIRFSAPKILIQGPVYSKKVQGKSEECAKNQYLKVTKE